MRIIAAVLAGVALAAGGAGATASSGVRGVATRSPTKPVCERGSPCSAPAAGIRLIFVRGDITRTTTTDELGRYRIALAPGVYALRIPTARFAYTPKHVGVSPGTWTIQKIAIDTGIR